MKKVIEKEVLERKREIKCYAEQNVLELACVFDVEKKKWDGRICREFEIKQGHHVKVWAHPLYGFLNEFDANVLFVIFFLLGDEPAGSVVVTKYRLAKTMGVSVDSKTYRALDISISKLTHSVVETTFFFDYETKERIKVGLNFIDSYRVTKNKIEIMLGRALRESVKKYYLKKISLTKILKLKGLAKLFYLFLAKRCNGRFEAKIETLLRVIGKKEEYDRLRKGERKKRIKRYIIPAVMKAAAELGYEAKVDAERRKVVLEKLKENIRRH